MNIPDRYRRRLSKEEESRLFKEGKADVVVKHTLGLAASMAYARASTPYLWDELYQAACEGVVIAAKKFNPDLGYRFSTYAACYIRKHIAQHLRVEARSASRLNGLQVDALEDNGTAPDVLPHSPDVEEMFADAEWL